MGRRLFSRRNEKQMQSQKQKPKEENFAITLFKELNKNTKNLKKMIDEADDLVIREFTVGQQNYPCAIVYIDGLIDRDLVQNSLLESLQNITNNQQQPKKIEAVFTEIYQEFISIT